MLILERCTDVSKGMPSRRINKKADAFFHASAFDRLRLYLPGADFRPSLDPAEDAGRAEGSQAGTQSVRAIPESGSMLQQPDDQLLCRLYLCNGKSNEVMHHALEYIELMLDPEPIQLFVKFEDVRAEHIVGAGQHSDGRQADGVAEHRADVWAGHHSSLRGACQ